jgi:hypothetical protein
MQLDENAIPTTCSSCILFAEIGQYRKSQMQSKGVGVKTCLQLMQNDGSINFKGYGIVKIKPTVHFSSDAQFPAGSLAR